MQKGEKENTDEKRINGNSIISGNDSGAFGGLLRQKKDAQTQQSRRLRRRKRRRREAATLRPGPRAGERQAETGPGRDRLAKNPVQIIVAQTRAAGIDTAARLIISYMEKELGQPFVVNNVSGGAGIAATQVKDSKPDGYTMLVCRQASDQQDFRCDGV